MSDNYAHFRQFVVGDNLDKSGQLFKGADRTSPVGGRAWNAWRHLCHSAYKPFSVPFRFSGAADMSAGDSFSPPFSA